MHHLCTSASISVTLPLLGDVREYDAEHASTFPGGANLSTCSRTTFAPRLLSLLTLPLLGDVREYGASHAHSKAPEGAHPSRHRSGQARKPPLGRHLTLLTLHLSGDVREYGPSRAHSRRPKCQQGARTPTTSHRAGAPTTFGTAPYSVNPSSLRRCPGMWPQPRAQQAP